MARRIAALLRHGDYCQRPDTPSALQPFPLNAAGEQQARAGASQLIDDLRGRDWQLHSVIDSSRLLRGWQTAQLVCEELAHLSGISCEVESFSDLAERSVGIREVVAPTWSGAKCGAWSFRTFSTFQTTASALKGEPS